MFINHKITSSATSYNCDATITFFLIAQQWKTSDATNRLLPACNLLYNSVPSPRGGFGWLSPPEQSSKPPQIEIWNTINQWNFCQIWMSSPSYANVKPPAQT